MVSIPDWNRLKGLSEAGKDTISSESKYQRVREEKYIKQAEEHGYFLNPTRSYIEKNFIEKQEEEKQAKSKKKISVLDKLDKKQRDLGELLVLKLTHARMRGVGDIGLCSRLTVCILSNNFITKFDGLVSCINLCKLDLHSNQISLLPNGSFWGGLSKLRILNLHDNPLGHIDNLHFLSNCPVLNVLTLFDTPLSLKKNYRHHVVNSIWTLKAVDWHVISDEEIIEDADFGGKFAALSNNFKLDLCPILSMDASNEEELDSIRLLLDRVNLIMSHNCPVLIIQRYTRGFLFRRRLKLIQELKLWAAITIQRKFREWRGFDTPRTSHMPPPPSPLVGEQVKQTGAPSGKDAEQQQVSTTQAAEEVKLDYDTYLRNRRPGSTGFSEASMSSRHSKKVPFEHDGKIVMPTIQSHLADIPANTHTSDGERSTKMSVFINLAKLQATTMQNLQNEVEVMDTAAPSEVTFISREDRVRKEALKKIALKEKKIPEKKRVVIKNVKQFFGPVVENPPTPTDETYQDDADDEIPRISFRLRGIGQEVTSYDPTTDMIIARREAGLHVRAAEDEYHTKKNMTKAPERHKPRTEKQQRRLHSYSAGDISLSSLKAVEKAYKERQRAEKHVRKLENVLNLRDQRESARERIRLYQDEKRTRTLREREQDQKKMMDILEKREMRLMNYLNKNRDQRERSSSYHKQRRGEYSFMVDFNVQNSSVSNALLRHDRQARFEDKTTDTLDKTQMLRSVELDQRNIVKTYLEHRQLMRQAETSVARAAIDAKMLQEANDRLMEARQRVAQQKARSAQVQALFPTAPSVSSHSLPVMDKDKVKSMKGLDRWNTSALVNEGRVGKHPVSVLQ